VRLPYTYALIISAPESINLSAVINLMTLIFITSRAASGNMAWLLPVERVAQINYKPATQLPRF
jgi:hypothetical protein